jgi:predicted nucleic acid-binding protein
MRNHILDASSIYTLVKHAGDNAPRILRSNTTIPLATYELGNAIWRETHLLKLLTDEEAKELLTHLYTLIDTMTLLPLNPRRDGEATLESALATGLNFYDASYLSAAIKTGYPLVTEDKQLTRIAERLGVKTTSWRGL